MAHGACQPALHDMRATDRDLLDLIKLRSAEYRALTDAYDDELLKAHNCAHGSPEIVEHLRRANEMAPDEGIGAIPSRCCGDGSEDWLQAVSVSITLAMPSPLPAAVH